METTLKKSNIDKQKLFLLLLIAFVVLCSSGWLFFITEKAHIREEKALQLAAIGDLKASQIEKWIKERKAEGVYFHSNTYFKTAVKDFIKAPLQLDNKNALSIWLLPFMSGHEYTAAYLVTPDKKVFVFSHNPLISQSFDDIFKQNRLSLNMHDKAVKMSDVFQTSKNGKVFIDMLTTIPDNKSPKKNLAYLIFRLDPTVQLFNDIKGWPTPSKTSETYVVRSENNRTVYINELRHLKNKPLAYSISNKDDKIVDVSASNGMTGIIDGPDYRGIKVLANIHKINHAKWVMIAKVDQSEIYSTINYLAVLITLFVILLFSITVILLLFINKNAISKTYKQLYEKELENNALKQKYDYLMQSANDIILIYNLQGVILAANESAVLEYGYSQEELIGMNIEDLHSFETKADFKKNIQKIKEFGRLRSETKHVRKDGTYLIIEASSRLINISDETLILGIIRNITEQRQAQEDLMVAKRRAEESDHLKTFFINNLSHEIRTPLNAIIGFSKLLDDKEISVEERIKFIKIIDKSSKELLNNFSNIIDIAQLETEQIKINLSKVDIATIMSKVETFLKEELSLFEKSNIKININLASQNTKALLDVDEERLIQILEHLISNAVKFTKEGNIIINCNVKESDILFSIRDTGIGISPEQQCYIFDRFRKANESYNTGERGTGLGLSISKGLIRLMGGDIWVESTLGIGSTFYLKFPLNGARCIKTTEENIVENTKYKTPVILIAEDEMYNMFYFQEVFRIFNVELLDARDGIEALHILENRNDVDLVLLDLKMPGMGGYEVLRQAKPLYPSLKFIAQTAYAMFDDRTKCLKSGFDDYISKPISQADLLRIIDNQLSSPLTLKS